MIRFIIRTVTVDPIPDAIAEVRYKTLDAHIPDLEKLISNRRWLVVGAEVIDCPDCGGTGKEGGE